MSELEQQIQPETIRITAVPQQYVYQPNAVTVSERPLIQRAAVAGVAVIALATGLSYESRNNTLFEDGSQMGIFVDRIAAPIDGLVQDQSDPRVIAVRPVFDPEKYAGYNLGDIELPALSAELIADEETNSFVTDGGTITLGLDVVGELTQRDLELIYANTQDPALRLGIGDLAAMNDLGFMLQELAAIGACTEAMDDLANELNDQVGELPQNPTYRLMRRNRAGEWQPFADPSDPQAVYIQAECSDA